jgi:hypothetical protein
MPLLTSTEVKKTWESLFPKTKKEIALRKMQLKDSILFLVSVAVLIAFEKKIEKHLTFDSSELN